MRGDGKERVMRKARRAEEWNESRKMGRREMPGSLPHPPEAWHGVDG